MRKDLVSRNLSESAKGQFLIYEAEDGRVKIDVRLSDETVWLTQQLMADLFQTTKQNIGQHLKNIFSEGELFEDSVVKKFFTTAADGKNYATNFYNLDAIISVGYRVKSAIATRFRIWATQRLREYIVKGYLLDDDRLKNPDQPFDYFDELMRRIQDIRTSERRFYQKITDIYATSVDYNRDAPTTKTFFAKVQNKLHFAIHGHTAAELILQRADSSKANMGLTSWENAPEGKILKTDVGVAKNYLAKEELESLGRIVNAYLDLAEERAIRKIPMTMEDWSKRLDAFLEFTERDILEGSGKVSAEIARAHAESEFEKYRIVQDRLFESDFDKAIKQIEIGHKKGSRDD